MNIYRNLSKKCKQLLKDFKIVLAKDSDLTKGNIALSINKEADLATELAMYLATKRKKRFIYFLTKRELKLPLPVDSEEGIGWDFNVAFTDSPDLIFGDDVVCIIDGASDFTKEQIDSIHTSKIFMFSSITDFEKYTCKGNLSTVWYKFLAEYPNPEDIKHTFTSTIDTSIITNPTGGI